VPGWHVRRVTEHEVKGLAKDRREEVSAPNVDVGPLQKCVRPCIYDCTMREVHGSDRGRSHRGGGDGYGTSASTDVEDTATGRQPAGSQRADQ
jgi:hypothetical protein